MVPQTLRPAVAQIAGPSPISPGLPADARLPTTLQLLDEFVHSGRTPLTVITEFASLLGEGAMGEINTDQKRAVDLIGDRAWDLARWIDQLADSAALMLGSIHAHRANCSVARLLGAVVPRASRKASLAGRTLHAEIDEGLPDVFCDAIQGQRVFAHLCCHALNSAEAGSGVSIRATMLDTAQSIVVEFGYRGLDTDPHAFAPLAQQLELPGHGPQQWEAGFNDPILAVVGGLVRFNFGEIEVCRSSRGTTAIRVALPIADPVALIRAFLRAPSPSGSASLTITAMIAEARAEPIGRDRILKNVLASCIQCGEVLIPVDPTTWLVLLRGTRQRARQFQLQADRLFKTFGPPADTGLVRCRILGSGAPEFDAELLELRCVRWLAAHGSHPIHQ